MFLLFPICYVHFTFTLGLNHLHAIKSIACKLFESKMNAKCTEHL